MSRRLKMMFDDVGTLLLMMVLLYVREGTAGSVAPSSPGPPILKPKGSLGDAHFPLPPAARECEKTLTSEHYDLVCEHRVSKNPALPSGDNDAPEYICKYNYYSTVCIVPLACSKACTAEQGKQYRDISSILLDAGNASCQPWFSDLSRLLDCSAYPPQLLTCVDQIAKNGDYGRCMGQANASYPLTGKGVTQQTKCRHEFSRITCEMGSACKLCNGSTADYIAEAQAQLKELETVCKTWWNKAPKLDCSSNLAMIIGICVAVGAALLIAIGLIIYCCKKKKDTGGASSGGTAEDGKARSGKSKYPKGTGTVAALTLARSGVHPGVAVKPPSNSGSTGSKKVQQQE